jgi:hypothetical protein
LAIAALRPARQSEDHQARAIRIATRSSGTSAASAPVAGDGQTDLRGYEEEELVGDFQEAAGGGPGAAVPVRA